MTNILAIIGGIALVLPFMFFMTIAITWWRAWWLYPAWGWFVVPLGAPEIRFWHFAALMVLVATLTSHADHFKEERKMDWAKVAMGFLLPVFMWVVLYWMRGR